jgi:hypothetical protein
MTTSGKTLAQRIAAIEALDLEPIKFKTTRPNDDDGYGWSVEQAQRAATSYKRYLILRAKHPAATLVPDKDTDRFWHMHILDTRKYAVDCDKIFGKFMHHYPYFGLRGEDDARTAGDAFATTQRLLAEEFGGGATRAAAFCADELPPQKAAFCADELPPQKAAFCADELPPQKAAFCADELPPQKAAFCADQLPPGIDAAWCAYVQPPTAEAA